MMACRFRCRPELYLIPIHAVDVNKARVAHCREERAGRRPTDRVDGSPGPFVACQVHKCLLQRTSWLWQSNLKGDLSKYEHQKLLDSMHTRNLFDPGNNVLCLAVDHLIRPVHACQVHPGLINTA